MITLMIMACTIADPIECHREYLMFANVTPFQCIIGGQAEVDEWSNEHPGYRVKKWQCGPAEGGETEA